MSNSLLPKKAPNVFNQETLERALVLLRQPFSIAVVASLAAHGLLWAALPNVLDPKKEPEPPRRVKVVELSPAERSQLPQLGINSLPQTLVPVKPLQPSQSGTKLPDPKLFNDSSLDTIPIFPLPPPNIFSPGLPRSLFDNPTPPKPPQNSPSPKPTASSKPTPKPTPTSTGGSAQPSVTPTEPAQSNNKSPQEKIAALQAEQRQLQALYTFNGVDQGKAFDTLKTNLPAFNNEVAAVKGNDYDKSSYWNEPKNVDIPFPTRACLVMKEQFLKDILIASIAAYVNTNGELEGSPGLLSTSGFSGLDQIAVNYVRGLTFKSGDKPRLVRFTLRFDPRTVCPKPSKAA